MYRTTARVSGSRKLFSTPRAISQLKDCLASGDLTFEKFQTQRFTDSTSEVSENGNNVPEQAIGRERSSGSGADSGDETSSLESASNATSDATDVSVASDVENEAQIDVEELLENFVSRLGAEFMTQLMQ
ncbi:hypothetical protein INS49_005574, partial [Diaporthe citri]|uniref:uncharacterized protein n=1 Tax=Diaporthe citri TaxID=83186 RepID=UPI001C8027C0